MAHMDQPDRLRRLQETELEVLDAIEKVCSRHGITWWLYGGSALGACRHGGFIPWDDDIDIGMLREDYNRFCDVAVCELPEGFSFHNARQEDGFAALFSKVWKDGTKFYTQETIDAGCSQGVFVDIFPFDFFQEGDARSRAMRRDLAMGQTLSYLYHSSHVQVPGKGVLGVLQKIACHCAHYLVKAFVPKEKIVMMFDRASRTFDSGEKVISSAYPYTDPLPIEWIVPVGQCRFEGRDCPCPRRLEDYLDIEYGDWRRLPPEAQRKTHLPLVLEF